MNDLIPIKLISPSVWQYIAHNTFWGLPQEISLKAQAIVGTLHNRHIGISPQSAVGLASLIVEPHNSRYAGSAWKSVLERLENEVTMGKHTLGILPGALTPYTVIRLAAPIIKEACQKINMCCLFCEDEIECDITPDDYKRYSSLLEIEIKKMAENKEDSFQLFWTDRAVTLSAYSRGVFQWEHIPEGLPETSPPSLGLMLRLKPETPKDKNKPRLPKPLTQPLKNKETNKTHEGGFSGVHVTRRQEDMGDILLSEFINPPLLLAERLTNNGYLALRRQPKRENMRDALIIGMMPGDIQSALSRDFIKTCWLDTLSRLGLLLLQTGQIRSEFRWLEEDSSELGLTKTCSFLLQNLPAPFEDIIPGSTITPTLRREFLAAMGWLPQYLDTHNRFEIKMKGNGKKQEPLSSQQWAFSTWRNQQENLLWTNHEPGTFPHKLQGNKKLEVSRFTTVYIMLFLPAEKRQKDFVSSSTVLSTVSAGFGFGNGSNRKLGITWVPKKIEALDQWAVDFRGKQDTVLFPSASPQQNTTWNIHRIAGRLIESWKNHLLKS
jgi:hypothetical protein